VPFRPLVARWPCQFWVDYTTNILGRKFPIGTTIIVTPILSGLHHRYARI
jgi:hypothetical protein